MVTLHNKIKYLYDNKLFDKIVTIGVHDDGFFLRSQKFDMNLNVPISDNYIYLTYNEKIVKYMIKNINNRYHRAIAMSFLDKKK